MGPPKETRPFLWTIGYEGLDQASFVQLLKQSAIQQVVDVRQLPLSRKKGFSKRPLSARLEAEGIHYEHLPQLGAPKELRHALREGGPWDPFESGYKEHMASVPEAFDRLRALVAERRSAILCFEADAAHCHRGILANRLMREGWTVVDLPS